MSSFFSFLFFICFVFFLLLGGRCPLFCTLDRKIGGVEDQGCMNLKGLQPCSNAMNTKYLHKDFHLLVQPLLEARHLPG